MKEDPLKDKDTQFQATNILRSLTSPTTHFMMISWTRILKRLNETNKTLQKTQIRLKTLYSLYESFEHYFQDLREKFEEIETEMFAKFETLFDPKSGTTAEPRTARTRKKNIFHDEPATEVVLTGSTKMRVEEFNVIIDQLVAEMARRKQAY